MTDIKTSVLYISGQPALVTLDYLIETGNGVSEFRLSYYPHRLEIFKNILKEIFGATTKHSIFGDFKTLKAGDAPPAFYIHVLEKSN